MFNDVGDFLDRWRRPLGWLTLVAFAAWKLAEGRLLEGFILLSVAWLLAGGSEPDGD